MHNEQEKPDSLDRLLDGALGTYSQAEPPAGLEDRILGNLQNAPKPWAWLGWPQLAWSAVAAVVVAGAVLWVTYKPAAQPPEVPITQVNVKSLQPPIPSGKSKTPAPTTNGSGRLKILEHGLATRQSAGEKQVVAQGQQPVFPAPAPLSEQEKRSEERRVGKECRL